MNSWKVTAGVLLVFVCGAALGALCMRFYMDYRFMKAMERPHLPMEEDFLARIDNAVGLRPEQKPEVLEILRNMLKELYVMQKEIEPRRDQAVKDSAEAIRQILDEKQNERFSKFLQRVEKFRSHMPGPPPGAMFGPPPGPPPGHLPGPPPGGNFGPEAGRPGRQ